MTNNNMINYEHHNYYHRLYDKYMTVGANLSVEEFIDLGKNFREVDEKRFNVHACTIEDGKKKYKYIPSDGFRKFLDDFSNKVGSETLGFRQKHHFVARYKNRALIVKNLYEKSKRKQMYSTISEQMWCTVLGVNKNTQFINHLIDCGAIIRVYNASSLRGISSIYFLNYGILKQIYDAFDSLNDFWKNYQTDIEIDDVTFEELGSGQFSETVSLFNDNVGEVEDRHSTFVEFCSNKMIIPDCDVIEDLNKIFAKNVFRTGVNYRLQTLNDVARVYGYLYDMAEIKGDIASWRKVANSIYTNAHNYIKYAPSIHIEGKVVKGVGIRAVTELCTKPKFETLKKTIEDTIDDENQRFYLDGAYRKSREFILDRYGELEHFDASSSIPHVMMLMNTGIYDTDKDLYYHLADRPLDWNECSRKIYKQSYMQAHFSDSSVPKIFSNILYDYRQKGDSVALDWLNKHKSDMYNFIANVQTETPDGLSTMDFYHESNIFILLRKYWTIKGVKVIGQVYDSFWFEKGIMSEKQFKDDLKYVSEIYYKGMRDKISPDTMLNVYNNIKR